MTECKTCYGYGLWAMGDPVPMGELDAKDGEPTTPCPECGKDYNSVTAKRVRWYYDPANDLPWLEKVTRLLKEATPSQVSELYTRRKKSDD